MSVRFKKSIKLVVGRIYHLKQINRHKAYLLLEILNNNTVKVLDLEDKKKKPRIVNSEKLLNTHRHRDE